MAESIGEVFGIFEGETCGFPGSEDVVRIVRVGFVDGDWSGFSWSREEEGEREMLEFYEEEKREL